ncbi:MAG TPA: YkgJ family cysteine cluster protein [Kofleriaceae bacterium]|nr:YkgJ family cysteine cluster protein [Kofleriaceae bacterium]
MSRYGELTAKVDAFFARVQARHGSDMQCGSGCSDCCHVRLSVTAVEAHAIRELVAAWPAEQRTALVERARAAAIDRCAALDDAGRCAIYTARPITCRSHGAPIRMREGALPVVRTCFRNFTQTAPDADCVLDQQTLSALVLAVNDRDDARIDLAELLSTC